MQEKILNNRIRFAHRSDTAMKAFSANKSQSAFVRRLRVTLRYCRAVLHYNLVSIDAFHTCINMRMSCRSQEETIDNKNKKITGSVVNRNKHLLTKISECLEIEKREAHAHL